MKRYRLWIGGEWIDAQGSAIRKLVSPSTGETLLDVPDAGTSDVHRAVAAAARSFEEGAWSRSEAGMRARVLSKIASLLRRNATELSRLEARNVGKPILETELDVEEAARRFERGAEWCGESAGGSGGGLRGATGSILGRGDGRPLALIVRDPLGVVAHVVPWSSPLLMAAATLAPALAAGCSCILKPATETPLTALELARLAARAGLPAGVLNVVTGDSGTCVDSLRHDPAVDRTVQADGGSAWAGDPRTVDPARAGAEDPGRRSACVVLEDADVGVAVAGVVAASLANQGQARSAASRILVHEAVHARFVEGLTAAVRGLRLGDPLDRETQMGPLVSGEHRDRVLSQIKLGRREGARLVTGGAPPKDARLARGFYVEPAIFTEVDPKMRVAREEILGPVLSILRFKNDDEAVSVFNDARAVRAGAVWTRDVRRGVRTLSRMRAGRLWLNAYRQREDEAAWDGGWRRARSAELDDFLATRRIEIDLV